MVITRLADALLIFERGLREKKPNLMTPPDNDWAPKLAKIIADEIEDPEVMERIIGRFIEAGILYHICSR